MSPISNIRLAFITASLLLPLAVGCGEIELPTHVNPLTPEEPSKPADEDKDEGGQTDNGSNEPEEGTDDGNQGEGNENESDDETRDDNDKGDQSQDVQSNGTAVLTSDGHILIGNRLYLSVIEYFNIKGDEAKNVEDKAKQYTEGSLKGWRVPTHDDVTILTGVLTSENPWYGNSALALLNQALEDSDSENCDLIYLYEGTSNPPSPIYYLSDGGTTAYTYAAGISQPFITVKASKKYRLRLVKDK